MKDLRKCKAERPVTLAAWPLPPAPSIFSSKKSRARALEDRLASNRASVGELVTRSLSNLWILRANSFLRYCIRSRLSFDSGNEEASGFFEGESRILIISRQKSTTAWAYTVVAVSWRKGRMPPSAGVRAFEVESESVTVTMPRTQLPARGTFQCRASSHGTKI